MYQSPVSRWTIWSAALVLVVLVLGSCLTNAQSFGSPVVVYYNTQAETLYTDLTVAQSFDSSMTMCMANGLNLLSGETAERTQRLWTLSRNTFPGGVGYSSYTSLSAKKMAGNTRCIYTNRAMPIGSDSTPSPDYCIFSVQWGLFTRSTIGGFAADQPGVGAFTCVFKYWSDGVTTCAAPMPLITTSPWDTGVDNPNGQNYTLITTNTARTAAAFANIAATAPSTFYLPVSKFVTACEAQIYLAATPQTFNATQPSFVLGYKELTWVQEHWWVLFLIIAIILLIVLFAILIFCCITSAPPKEGPPIAPMVLRERNGQAYVNESDDDSTPKSRDLNIGEVSQVSNVEQPQGAEVMMEMMPMMPVPMVDPEDLIQATPSIYSQDDVMQTAESNSMASDEDESSMSEEDENSR